MQRAELMSGKNQMSQKYFCPESRLCMHRAEK